MAWSGPYKVLERHNKVNYLINEGGKSKLYHANLLKRYRQRASVQQAYLLDDSSPIEFLSDDMEVVRICALEADLVEGLNDLPVTPDGRTDVTLE